MVRLVFDLKEEIKPQVFTLAPVGAYKHRLIFDLYPVQPVDPIAAMIEKGDWSRDPAAPIGKPELPGAPPDPLAKQETEMPAMVVVKPEPPAPQPAGAEAAMRARRK